MSWHAWPWRLFRRFPCQQFWASWNPLAWPRRHPSSYSQRSYLRHHPYRQSAHWSSTWSTPLPHHPNPELSPHLQISCSYYWVTQAFSKHWLPSSYPDLGVVGQLMHYYCYHHWPLESCPQRSSWNHQVGTCQSFASHFFLSSCSLVDLLLRYHRSAGFSLTGGHRDIWVCW